MTTNSVLKIALLNITASNQKCGIVERRNDVSEERCVMCGETIPEGRMICRKCEDVEPSFNATEATISLSKIKDLARFVKLVSKCPGDVVVKSGHFAVDAKSIMGLCSLDLSKSVNVEFYGDIPYEVKEGLKKFMVN